MRILSGSELVGYIKERQAKEVRMLRQAKKIFPRLAIVLTVDNPVIETYVRLKKQYGADILIDVDVRRVGKDDILATISELNADETIHGIIVQLPLLEGIDTSTVLNAVSPEKDVDGLGVNATIDPATPKAINWLLAGYNIELKGKKIAIVGKGRLVGEPLNKMWHASGLNTVIFDSKSNLQDLSQYDVIVSATGVPNLITRDMVSDGAVVVDAGTASEDGKIIGDISPEVRELENVIITPIRGGVGPLTVSALFDNVIQAARESA